MAATKRFPSRHNSSTAKSPMVILLFLVAIALVATVVDGLDCYQCASLAANGGDCANDYQGLLNATKNETRMNSPYRKDCTGSNPIFTRCFIEYRLGPEDKYLFYHRGCHDGVTFNQKVDSERFVNLSANNETTCAAPEKLPNTGVCYIFCDTDMCNGPLPKIDPCENYNASDPFAVLPKGVICGVSSFHDNASLSVVLSVLISGLCSMSLADFMKA